MAKAPVKKAPVKNVAAKKTVAKKPAAKKPATKRKPNAAFMKPVTPTEYLAAVVGSKPLPRTEIVSKIWEYIKKHKLQDEKNKRMINADEKLKPLFGGKKQISMLELAKYISKNVE
jgi:upstream activation factor subunit UAF30